MNHLSINLSPGSWNKVTKRQLWHTWGYREWGVILKGRTKRAFLLVCKGKIKHFSFWAESDSRYYLIQFLHLLTGKENFRKVETFARIYAASYWLKQTDNRPIKKLLDLIGLRFKPKNSWYTCLFFSHYHVACPLNNKKTDLLQH